MALLGRLAADPGRPISRVPVLTEQEREASLSAWNDTARPVERRTVPELFADAARRRGDQVALVTDGRRMTFDELSAEVDRIAGLLLRRGLSAESVVGLALPRAEMVPAILGVLTAGAAYLPLDPGYPAERLEYMLDDAAPVCVLTTSAIAPGLPAGPADLLLLDDPQTLAECGGPLPGSGFRRRRHQRRANRRGAGGPLR